MGKQFIDMKLNEKSISLFHGEYFRPTKRQLNEMSKYINGKAAGNVLKKKISNLVRRNIKRNFQMKRDAEHVPWKPLSKQTQRIRRKKGFGNGPPLIRTKKLWNSATGDQVVSFSRRGLLIRPRSGRGTQAHKWAMHNRPSNDMMPNPNGGPGDIPGRQFYYLDGESYQVIANIMLLDMIGNLSKVVRGKNREGIMLTALLAKAGQGDVTGDFLAGTF